jgi:hypothetical protein
MSKLCNSLLITFDDEEQIQIDEEEEMVNCIHELASRLRESEAAVLNGLLAGYSIQGDFTPRSNSALTPHQIRHFQTNLIQ